MPHPDPDKRTDLPEFEPDRPAPAWRRWLVRLLAAVALLATLVLAAGWFLLRTDTGRQWLLSRVGTYVQSSTGWSLTVHDASLRLTPGRLVAQGVRFGAPGADPLVAADRVEVDFAWRNLLERPLRLDRALVRGLVVDTTAEIPPGDDSEESDDAGTFPLSLPDLRIEDAEILGGPTEGWLKTWSVRDLVVAGGISDGGFDASVERGILRLARRDAPPLDLDLSGEARGPFAGPYTVQNVDVEGEGLDAGGSGTAGVGDDEPLAADFHLRADARRLLGAALPSISPPRADADALADESGVLRGQGRFDFRRQTGELELRLDDVPVELFEPAVGTEWIDRLAARGTRLDGSAEASLAFGSDAAPAERLSGRADLTWRHDTQPLLDLQVRTLDVSDRGDPVRLAVDASLLPGWPGGRRLEASLRAPSWTELAKIQSDIATVALRVPELAGFRRQLERRWPRALETLPPLPWQGSLDLRARVTGSLRDPEIDGDGTWRPATGSSVRLEAQGRPLSSRGRATITTESFELEALRPSLGHLVADLRGRLDGRLEVGLGTNSPAADGHRVGVRGHMEAADMVVQRTAEAPHPDLLAQRLSFEGEASMPWTATAPTGASSPTFGDLRADARLGVRELVLPTGPKLANLDLDARLRDADVRIRRAEGRILPPEPVEKERPDQEPGTDDPAVLVTSTEAAERRGEQEMDESDLRPEPTPPRSFGAPVPFVLAGSAGFLPDRPWTEPLVDSLDLRLSADQPHPAVERVEFDARLQEGVLGLDLVALDLPEGGPRVELLTAYLPLRALGRLPGLEGVIESLPLAEAADGELRIAFELPGLDTGDLYRWLGQEPPAEQLRASLEGGVQIRPDAPTASTAEITVRDVEIELAEQTFRSAEPQTISLEDYRLRLERGLWQARNRSFDAEAEVVLEPGWRLDQALSDAVDSFSAVATGSLEASLLNGYLAGGRAQGLAEVTVLAAGTPDDNAAEIDMVGDEDTTFTWVEPYATHIASPTVRMKVEDGIVSVTEANARLNEGRLDVEGTVLDDEGQTHLSGFLDSVRYRLDYGLTVLLSGNFDLRLFPERPGELSANILVERGFLRRQLDPDRELVNILLQPPDLDMGDASDLTRSLRLDIDVATVEGVRIKNNVADLHASWAPLEVAGTLDEPAIRGSIEVDPGGKIYAWGQVVRLDRATLEFSGQPDVPARLDLTTTSSLEDPSIATSSDRRLIAEMAEPVPLGSTESEEQRFDRQAITSGLTTYYGDQLASRLGSSLSGPRIEYRPLRIFGESSPEAKLVVSQDLSPHISLAAAFGLREAEDRTYLLDFHDFEFLPSLSATAFTTEVIDYGVTMQQMLRLGGSDDANEEDLPRLDDIVIRCPGCRGADGEAVVKERKIRRAVGYRTDDLIPDGSDFDIEVDVEEFLRQQGFPDPEVKADVDPDKDPGFVDVVLEVELGPRAFFDFEGEVPPRNRRDSIRSLYRVDYYEATAIEEMREQTERVWQSLGHPEPEVTVRAERLDPDDPRSDRRVTVVSQPGRKLELESLEFWIAEQTGDSSTPADVEGAPALRELPEPVVWALRNRFESQLWRVRLAAGDEAADDRLLRAMTSEGFPQAELVRRELIEDDEVLRVWLRPGPRRQLESLEIRGLEFAQLEIERLRVDGLEGDTAVADLRRQLDISEGDPYVSSRVAREAARLEAALRSRGYYEAKVRTEIDLQGAEDLGADVRLIAEPGDRYLLREVEIRGALHTRESWIRDLIGLEPGAPLDRRKVGEARRKLVETRLFSRVTVDAQHSPEGTTLVFDLVEQPRFELAYGGRWESEGGFGGIFEALDNNFTGRGVDLGFRVLYGETDRRARFYSRIPRLFDHDVELELFAEVFDDVRDQLETVGWEVTGQLKLQFRPRLEGRLYGRFVDEELTDLTARIVNPERERTPTLGVQLIWDTRNRILDPTRGRLMSLDLSGARDFIADEDEYLRFYGQINQFTPFNEPRRPGAEPWVWSQSLRLGLSEIDGELPRSVRFFAGGPFSVRGYAERSLGPQVTNEDGSLRARGGQALLILNQEVRFPLPWWEGLQGVAFADAGNVWRDVDEISLDDLFTSLGLGVRADTPIGIVRLDFGVPLDGRLRDDDYEIYFGFGHAF